MALHKDDSKNVSTVTVNLPNEDILRMSEIARFHDTTKTTALVRSLRIAYFLETETRTGSTVYLREPDGTFREVQFD
ncbi:hypothetical protein [Rhodococcus sp. SJ-3]|uniref:hypothetical protein n=1 Tax=Rhodococcus sp. SJ-3 TaxID=3454628 RepID=UPI003F7A5F6A